MTTYPVETPAQPRITGHHYLPAPIGRSEQPPTVTLRSRREHDPSEPALNGGGPPSPRDMAHIFHQPGEILPVYA